MERYILGTSRIEQKRLLEQGALFEAEARWLLDEIGVEPAWRAVDLGCGPLGILHLLSERVGPKGEVVGVEREAPLLAVARDVVEERGLTNVRLVQGDATATGLPRAAFDLVHERLLLMITPDVARVLAEMIALACPGGVVVVQDLDVVSMICEPAHPAWTRLVEVYERVYRARGLDGNLGRRLPGLLRGAGLLDVRVHAHAQVAQAGELGAGLFLGIIEGLRDHIVGDGIQTDAELTALVDAVRRHLGTRGTLVLQPLLVQAWGRMPS